MTTMVAPMVKVLARLRGESQRAMAEAVGIHPNRMCDKLAGKRAFTEPEILALAAHFGVEPGHLFKDPAELLGVTGYPGCVTAGRPRLKLVA